MVLGIFIVVVIAGVVILLVFRSKPNKNDQRRREAELKHQATQQAPSPYSPSANEAEGALP